MRNAIVSRMQLPDEAATTLFQVSVGPLRVCHDEARVEVSCGTQRIVCDLPRASVHLKNGTKVELAAQVSVLSTFAMCYM